MASQDTSYHNGGQLRQHCSSSESSLRSSREHLIQNLGFQYHMCNETLAQCEQVFRVLDVNGDGYLTPDDLSRKMLRLGIPHSSEDVVHAVKELAGDDSNEIEFDDLIHLMTYETESGEELTELQETFKVSEMHPPTCLLMFAFKQRL
ncbi:unnamed protein product [Soboliphyme baturini]|uniref:EF-hand domain-containing protein n=1 Tax=Soboliphyme baturini TaxID=241478 RepID=A0A183J870_9BILA|nr:unnamed protein product [Soboliphyme baturini]